MTKTIARLVVAGAAAASIVLPATSASASCSPTLYDCIEELLSADADSDVCIPMGHTPPICLGPIST